MDAATLAALDRNYLDANRIFMACSDTGEYLERRDLALVCCGLPADDLNWGFIKPPVESPTETAGRVADYFAERKLRYKLSFRLGTAAAETCRRLLLEAGWQEGPRTTPGMARLLPERLPTPPEGLVVEEVATPEGLVAYREAAFEGFGYPSSAAHIFLNERIAALPEVHLYAGLVEGEVVATSMLLVSGDVAGIYWVATRAAHRGRGYGEALTWATVEGAREHRCTILSLQASQLGRPVYERMGFDTVLEYASLRPPGRG